MEKYLDVLKSVDLFRGIEEFDLQPLLSCAAPPFSIFSLARCRISSVQLLLLERSCHCIVCVCPSVK